MLDFFIRVTYVSINFNMKFSYNWLKSYIPDAPDAQKLADVFTYHVCEVESLEKIENGDFIFDAKILPNRAHDLLSHQGIARELASLLNIKYSDPELRYKKPTSVTTNLKIEIKSDKCRRYMGRIIRNIKVGPSPEWMKVYLESIGQRSINNMVDAANIIMFDCGQPTHVFDLDKVDSGLVVRQAENDENIITLDNKNLKLESSNLVIADFSNILAIAGIKGGKIAEVDENTKNIILEVANFDPTSVRKTAQSLNIFTDARKRFENDLSIELGSFAMEEFSALILEICPNAYFENIIDMYPVKQKERKFSFRTEKISSILGSNISVEEIKGILERYDFKYTEKNGVFEIVVPYMRLDLEIEEDMAEEIGRILGYNKIKEKLPEINWKPKINETYAKISWARNKLLNNGYSEVMTYTFCNKGEMEVLASASDKKFLRTNLSDGLKESLKLNQLNMPLLEMNEIKIFEIGTIFKKDGEEMHVAYADKKEIKEMELDKFVSLQFSVKNSGAFALGDIRQGTHDAKNSLLKTSHFKMWSLFPFISRDIAVWVPEKTKSEDVEKVIKNNMGKLVIRGPELFDQFKKDGKISYAFKLVFQSYDRTLTDAEINEIMTKITNKIKEKNDWQVR